MTSNNTTEPMNFETQMTVGSLLDLLNGMPVDTKINFEVIQNKGNIHPIWPLNNFDSKFIHGELILQYTYYDREKDKGILEGKNDFHS